MTDREEALRDAAFAAHGWIVEHMSELAQMPPCDVSFGIGEAIKSAPPRPFLFRKLCE